MQAVGASATDLAVTVGDHPEAALDNADLDSVLSGASQVSWTSFVDWAEVDKLIAEVDWSTAIKCC